VREIGQAAADAPRERSLGETGADRGRNLGHGDRMIEAANGTVGKRDVGHDRVSGSSCPRRRRGRGYETKNVDEKKARSRRAFFSSRQAEPTCSVSGLSSSSEHDFRLQNPGTRDWTRTNDPHHVKVVL